MNSELNVFFERVRPAIDATLYELLPSESVSPQRLHQAMRYSTLNGGIDNGVTPSTELVNVFNHDDSGLYRDAEEGQHTDARGHAQICPSEHESQQPTEGGERDVE